VALGHSLSVVGSVLVCVAVATAAGCGEDHAAPVVGPAPLRRMSNREYLNALADLFPDQSPALPPLPADTDVAGFENAAEAQQPSDVRIARFEAIANLYAAGATRDAAAVQAQVGCDSWTTPTQQAACARQLIERAGRKLFRRPVTAEEQDRFTLRFAAWTASIDFEAAVQLTLAAMLQSPQFLYRPEPVALPSRGAPVFAPVEPYAMASRLSFFLWESVPDEPLLEAAAHDQLRTEDQVRAQAERMLDDPRARRMLWDFHRQWLGLERVLSDEHQVRTPAIDPGWTASTPAAVLEESRQFVENVAPGGTLRDLLTSRRAWVNGDLARIYGVPAPADPAAWQEVELPAAERAGLLTRAAFLAGTSHRGGTSPPIRGNAIQLRLLCRLAVSPPPGADLSMPTATPDDGPKTNRMLFEARTSPPQCQGCHVGLNGFGFGFEHYNAAGGFQSQEQGLPIDATGAITGTDVDGPFDGALALSAALGDSEQVYHCAAQQWLRFALGRAPVGEELLIVNALSAQFFGSGGDLRALALDIVTAPTFRLRKIEVH
jgi:Protein of unknown function (DUF1592)/Protein of unknown function (DUF1588)/Protein of unknown function (DUF1595)/Protein of unknown function (DUF1587)/Protein of unknown function (DUF1585)